MAIARYYGSKNTLTRLQVTDGEPTVQTAKRFVLEDGNVTATFLGQFTYGIFGSPFGTLDTYTYKVGGNLRLKIADIGADMYQVFTRLDFLSSAREAEKIIFALNDKIYGNDGRNLIEGYDGNDRIFGKDGSDQLYGGLGKDVLNGGLGADEIYGNDQSDRLLGGKGDDRLFGGTGSDVLKGGDGNDTLSGWEGKDTLDGGKGDDALRGESGRDVFLFRKRYGEDVIEDFEDDLDTIKLDDALWDGDLVRKQVVNRFAEVVNGDVVFDFGKDRLVIENFTDLGELADDLAIV
ncbi:calcium-binding protein [Tropicimonas aquimaris]|uniref:Calcium-binding protein n=1 Tax=Tropicimonas aquimaris TaxID=914152 RepID=A0ABW3IJD5_9RHOB